ncbi:GtrA family protein [Enterococcus mundtii]|uniref:GtrA family protein n=1 Tax=Enterococcus TaxID=1350 RepID=UPI000453A33F|nr:MULTISPECIES: GtrA family protein [Enterococcus]AZP92435.1 GtrA family protein [Enterococcus mundtii]EYT96044.1 teichoic acid glycosylation protein GtcA [Enterococcus mundtii CRL35]MDA9428770.1 Teichoic acid glycosylation protein [Enterococcus mundtii 1A]MDK4211461.1 GtrA family protein [Enterococcus mundtii]MDO7878823.1 GtrA family protein [Enterococcus mundtii]
MKIYVQFKSYLESKGYWEVFTYLFFGGLATIVNFVSYAIAQQIFQLSMPVSNTISWICSVLFAFVTNKVWVFRSKSPSYTHLFIEFGKFVFYRIVSYGLDMGAMILMINGLEMNDYVAKIITQILVVLANYVFSKLFIFNKTEIIEEPAKTSKKLED